ncbi:tyrosine-protein phosphatase [Anaerococcus sp. AGMB00486]|uniref:Tyrosine-protein phosphatase n=2 Tax=Anaerococcus TaxID=165779 RepID=A0ABX2N8N3_9FIRM|nr:MULTISPECIES: tyrosine-protein phosphatase [Anaerococcus]MDY3006174.1 tyrosine-protein phosphatase [Anaerococcus porci]MSS77148.1 tyrosine-protein phosphatase [Anaerococcus porci]NVF11048.1 tyrosine-protein phosphatase [Anaerococcus faecalis]
MEKIKYLKRLPFESIKNARDLGGMPTLDGEITSWSKFIRSANLDDITDKDISLLKDLNVSTIIDLRRDDEVYKNHKRLEKINENFSYHQVSLSPRAMRYEEIQRIIDKKDSIGKSYISIIDNYKAIRKVFEILADNDKVTLFHCQEGKDRTGIISMVLYGLANVARSDIIADYEISSANLGYIERYDQDEKGSIFRVTNPYNMKEAISYIIRKYQSFESYLYYAKLDRNSIDKLKKKLIE